MLKTWLRHELMGVSFSRACGTRNCHAAVIPLRDLQRMVRRRFAQAYATRDVCSSPWGYLSHDIRRLCRVFVGTALLHAELVL